MFIGYALLSALILTMIAVAVDCIQVYDDGSSRTSRFALTRYSRIAGGISFVVLAVVNWMILFWWNPEFEGAGWVGPVIIDLVIVLFVFGFFNYRENSVNGAPVLALVMILLVGIAGPIWNESWYGQDNADIMKSQLNVTMIESKDGTKTYPETDEQHMVVLGDQSARNKADSVMNQQNVGSRFELGSGELQLVNGHLYYVYVLQPKDYRSTKAAEYKSPGYVMVDAENPSVSARLETGYAITLWTDGWWGSNLERHVWQEFPGAYVDDLSLEVDDAGRPFYTASLNQTVVRWQQAMPAAFITVDAQTKKITQYPLNRIPAWVDRVYSDETARIMLDWWGRWTKAPYQGINEGKNDRFKVAGELNLVYTNEGPAWQALMTSWNSDQVVQYVALLDTRSNRVRMYPAPSGLKIEAPVADAVNRATKNVKSHDPTALALHKVYGKLVWVGSLVPDGRGGQTDGDGYPTKESFQGLCVLDALSSDGARVLVGNDKGDVFNQLATQIATESDNNSPEATAQNKTVEGIVSSISPPLVLGGDTFMILTLEGDADHLYRGKVTGSANSLSMTVTKPGDKVILTYVDTGKSVRNIASFKSATLAGVN